MPGDDWLKHFCAGAVDHSLEEAIDLREVNINMLQGVSAEISRRKVLEVGLEFLAGNLQR